MNRNPSLALHGYLCRMHRLPNHLKELYFTTDHEWVRFEGSTATIGLAPFKLTGYKKIGSFFLTELTGHIEAGTPLASFEYNDFLISMHMPVVGKLVEWNKNLLQESASVMLSSITHFTWIARIAPAMLYERANLLQAIHYKPLLKTQGIDSY